MATTIVEQPASATSTHPLNSLPAVLRPHPNLLKYYLLSAFPAGPGFPFLMLYFYFRYRTLHYDVDTEGITMRWGILFRREISLTYARIQDIHLTSNVIERWFGLAKIQVQTASGSSTAEMTIEGLDYYQQMRDFLYARMRGAREHSVQGPEAADELTTTLRDIAAELKALRTALTEKNV